MTVLTLASSIVYEGNGSTTVFAFPFKVTDEEHLHVTRLNAATNAELNEYDTSMYSVSGIGAAGGGSVTMLLDDPLSEDYKLKIERIVPLVQELHLTSQSGFDPETVEDEFDLQQMQIQQIANDYAGLSASAFRLPLGESIDPGPTKTELLGKFLAVDAEGNFVGAEGTGADGSLRSDLAASAGSGLVGFILNSIDAIARTLQSKLRDVISVKDFGAVGDGATDDTAAFTKAIAALSLGTIFGRNRQRRLYIPAGVYVLNSTITIPDMDFTMEGDGPEQTALLINHTSGHGIHVSALGDVRLNGFSVVSSTARAAAASDANSCGILIENSSSGASTSYRVSLHDVYVLDHPGHGIYHVDPESAELQRCISARNKLNGVYWHGLNNVGISNQAENVRCRDNGLYGIYLDAVQASVLTRVQCLNSASDQIRIVGENIVLVEPDCEAFSLVTSISTYHGIRLVGRGHKVIGATLYALNTGIRFASCDSSIVLYPRMIGKTPIPFTTGILIDSGSGANTIQAYTGNDVTTMISNLGLNNDVELDGQNTYGNFGVNRVVATFAASYTPDLSTGSYFVLTLTGNITINAPTHIRAGQEIIFEFIQDATGGRTVTWNAAWKQAWSNTGNVANAVCVVRFRGRGTATAIMESQGPYV